MSVNMKNRTIEIARRMAQLGQSDEACKAYALALSQMDDDPDLKLEAALYIFQHGGDYKISYTVFIQLYNQGYDQADLLDLLTGAFYTPNMKQLQTRYEKNCKLLSKYPYIFRKDFIPFGQLPIRFFPFDDDGYVPFDTTRGRFEKYVNFNEKRITHNFFRNLDDPILAHDIHSAYELHYLNDNVRKSEYVAKENHIYLHYSSWADFCAHLQVINLRPLLEDQKFVFLMEDEVSQYPIDFKERFGIDYSQYHVKPLGIREINRLIWHTQLSTHNGGDFFNEIFDNHPNLIAMSSVMFNALKGLVDQCWDAIHHDGTISGLVPNDGDETKLPRLQEELRLLKNATKKDVMVFLYLVMADLRPLDPASRIAPAIFFQPHFSYYYYGVQGYDRNLATLSCKEYEQFCGYPAVTGFPYIKSFTPMRRITTSYAASVHFMVDVVDPTSVDKEGHTKYQVITSPVTDRALTRSYLIDPQDRLYQDSVLVRFEDGKLNPKATFTALCAFLDLPYTESMTYCSISGERDPLQFDCNVRGFDPSTVYKTYDDYAGDAERYYLEYFMRDAYEAYGYDFHYYDGTPVDMDKVKELFAHMDRQDHFERETMRRMLVTTIPQLEEVGVANPEKEIERIMEEKITGLREHDFKVTEILLRDLHFVNKRGQPLKLMPKLELDPTLLEQPLYH